MKVLALAAFTIWGCSGGTGTVVVAVRTDLQQPIEFGGVRVRIHQSEIAGNATEFEEMRSSSQWLEGVRIAELPRPSSGTYFVEAEAYGERSVVVRRRVAVQSGSANIDAVTILLQRSCVAVSCDAGAVCVSGQCTSFDCRPGAEETCPDPDCERNSGCASIGDCRVGACVDGRCFVPADDTRCEGGSVCDVDGLCRAPLEGDAGVEADAGVDGGVADSGSDGGGADARAFDAGTATGLLVHFTFEGDDPGDGIENAASALNASYRSGTARSGAGYLGADSYESDSGATFLLDNSDGRFNTTDAFTVAAWVYNSNTEDFRTIAGKPYGSDQSNTWFFTINDQKPTFRVRVAGSDEWLVGLTEPLDTWFHVAATYDGSFIRLYVHGAEVGSTILPDPLDWDSSPVSFGSDWDFGTTPNSRFWGRIDDFRLYSRALSLSEVETLAGL